MTMHHKRAFVKKITIYFNTQQWTINMKMSEYLLNTY